MDHHLLRVEISAWFERALEGTRNLLNAYVARTCWIIPARKSCFLERAAPTKQMRKQRTMQWTSAKSGIVCYSSDYYQSMWWGLIAFVAKSSTQVAESWLAAALIGNLKRLYLRAWRACFSSMDPKAGQSIRLRTYLLACVACLSSCTYLNRVCCQLE